MGGPIGTDKLLLGLLEALEKMKQEAIKTLQQSTNTQINTEGLRFQKDFSIAAMKLRLNHVLLLTGDLGVFLGQCCHRSWEGKEILLFFGEGLEGFRIRSSFLGKGIKNLCYTLLQSCDPN